MKKTAKKSTPKKAQTSVTVKEPITVSSIITKSGKLEIFKTPANNQFYFHIISRNGRIICASETYTRMENLRMGVQALLKICNLIKK